MPYDWWDDFSTNLATDLAPLVALFGESPTKQFLSESVSLIDTFIFAMAPLGIITTVVSAIRVGGSPSLRAFIGRAQEGGGNIEAELCSSTSRDVCEMYNNGGIARVFGRPKILEVVHDPHADETDFYGLKGKERSAGIYLFKEYIESGRGDKEWDEVTSKRSVLHLWKKVPQEPESRRSLKDTVSINFAPHPNLSLNVGIKKRSPIWFFLAAVSGFLLQFGVLAFAGLSVFAFSKKFEKYDKPADSYAFPFTLAGTFLLCTGAGMCGHIVERSTTERIFRRKAIPRNYPQSRLFWIQPGNQVIGDQVFDSFAYNETSGTPLIEYTTSRRNPQDKKLQRTNGLLVWIFVPATVLGFILQFIGLRALHSTISIAQLSATIFMSIIRSMLRTERLREEDNRLGNDPDLFQGHELDWLAIELCKNDLKKDLNPGELPTGTSNNHATYIWQVTTCPTYPRRSLVSGEQLYARSDTKEIRNISRSIKETAIVLSSGFRPVPKSGSSDSTCGNKEINQWLAAMQAWESSGLPRPIPRIFLSRARIARMTGVDARLGSFRGDSSQWTEVVVAARARAASLTEAIRKTADALFSNYTSPPLLADGWTNASDIFLSLDCTAAELSIIDETIYRHKNPQRDRVYISLSRTSTDMGENYGQWNIDASELEAILSLWMWSLRTRSYGPTKSSATGEIDDSSAPSKRLNFERLQSTRLLFVSGAEAAGPMHSNVTLYQSTLSPWLGDLGTKVRRARLKYPSASGFDPVWVWTLNVDGKQQTSDQAIYSPMAFHQLQHHGVSNSHDWFFGWDSFVQLEQLQQQQQQQQQHSHWDLDALIMRTAHSPAIMCTQEIYTKLFRTLLTILEDIGGETKVMRGRRGFYLANDNITEIIKAFTDSDLGSENDARACIIPILLEQGKLPVVKIVAQARDLGYEYRREGAWKKAEEVLRWAFDTSLQSWKLCPPESEEQAQNASTALEDLKSTTGPNDPAGELWLCVVALCECYRWALFFEAKSGEYKQFGVQGIIEMLEMGKSLPHLVLPRLEDTLRVYGKVALRIAKESVNMPDVHKLGFRLEQMLKNHGASSKTALGNSSSGGNEASIENHGSSPESPPENIISAIKKGDMSAALYHLRGPSSIQQYEEGRSSLSLASERGWFIVAKSLIEVGATATQSDTLARTPLHFAASSGDKYLVTHLLEQGIDVNSRDAEQRTPLLIAAEHGHDEIVQILSKAGADVNSRDSEHRTPILMAAEYGYNEILALLLRVGANPSAEDKNNRTPLLFATWTRNIKAIQCLLDGGAKTETYYPPLSTATRWKSREMITLFLKAGADPNVGTRQSPFEKTYTSPEDSSSQPTLLDSANNPLEIAVILQLTDIVQELLRYGADPHISLRYIDVTAELLEFLWEKIKVIGLRSSTNGRFFLNSAIQRECPDIVKWTVAQPEVNISLEDLFRAICNSSAAIFQALLYAPNAPVNGTFRYTGHTLLTEAVSRGRVEVVKVLLAHPDVDIDRKDHYRMTADDWANRMNGAHKVEILELLNQERERRRVEATSESTGI